MSPELSPEFRQTPAQPTVGKRVYHQYTMVLDHQPQEVYPLLCPVRELDWVGFWECELIHYPTGLAEYGGVFRTDLPGDGPADWICVRQEAYAGVAYVTFYPGRKIRLLRIDIVPTDKGCDLIWHSSITALSPEGEAELDAYDNEAHRKEMEYDENALVHYLKTGRTLPYEPGR